MIQLICEECKQPFMSKRKKKKYCSCRCSNIAHNNERAKEMEKKNSVQIWSCGGGVQSVGIAALILQGKIPRPDMGLMVDTGFESEGVMAYVRQKVKPAMDEIGIPFEIIRTEDWLENHGLFDKKGYCVIPAFRRNDDGTVSRMGTRCNGSWKDLVIKRYLKANGITKCDNWIGISTDEAHRAQRVQKVKWMTKVYPLIEYGYSRQDCLNAIREIGWEPPERSSCIMCPLKTKYEWLFLSVKHPESFKRAQEIERDIRQFDESVWLTPNCMPLAQYIDME